MANFHSLMVSPNMSLSAEGYLICVNVPICRSGYQDYLGEELDGFPGYEKSWNLDPKKTYRVFRPKEEVLHPDTIASFEGKTVVDTHPASEGNVVDIENERYLNCGHIQNIRRGPDQDGEVTLIGNIVIKDPTLKEKVYPIIDEHAEPVRDVSCGYTLRLKRLKDGSIIMYHLRGNHVAVVDKGRAGPRIAIKDSAPPEIKPRKETTMSWRDRIFGLGLKAVVADASPEELKEITKEMEKQDSPRTEVDKKPAKDGQEDEAALDAKNPHHMAAHACLDRCLSAMKDGKHMGADAHGKPKNLESLKKELLKFLDEEETEPEHQADADLEELEEEERKSDKPKGQHLGDGEHPKGCRCDACKEPAADEELEQNEKTAAEENDKTTAVDGGEHAEKEIDDPGTSVLKAANDSVRSFIKAQKPIVASIVMKPKRQRTPQEQIAVDSYNEAVRTINSASGRSYGKLTKVKRPERIPALATDSAAVTGGQDQENYTHFYEGVPYAIGLKRHQEYLAQKGSK